MLWLPTQKKHDNTAAAAAAAASTPSTTNTTSTTSSTGTDKLMVAATGAGETRTESTNRYPRHVLQDKAERASLARAAQIPHAVSQQ